MQFGNYLLPLMTVPYLSRVLGPASWGLLAMAQAFALYGNLIVEYGFIYSATRQIATATTGDATAETVAGVTSAKLLLAMLVVAATFVAQRYVPMFRGHALLLWMATLAEIVKASLPNYFFYGVNRIALASVLDISARTAAAAGIFVFVHSAADAWKVFALQGAGALIALCIGQALLYRSCAVRWPRMRDGWRMLQEGTGMFLFRSAHNLYALGNAFILGLFAAPQIVGYYAGAEKINSAAVGLLSPLTTALYPRAASLAQSSPQRAARLTVISLGIVLAIGFGLLLLMWFGASLIVPTVLGSKFLPAIEVFRTLSLRSPLLAWTSVLGFQWLLPLNLEKSFRNITLSALVLNVLLATILAHQFGAQGMAYAVVISQASVAIGIYLVLKRRKLNPFTLANSHHA